MVQVQQLLQRLKGNKTLFNGVYFSAFAFIGRGISFVLLIILATYIPPSDYGKLSLFNTVVMLLGFIMAFSTNGFFCISFFKEDTKTLHQDFTFIILMLLFTVGLVSLAFLFFGDFFSELAGVTKDLLWWALLIAFVNVLFTMHTDYYRLQEKVKMFGVLNLGSALLNAFFSLLLVIAFGQGWMGRINTHIGVSLLFGIVASVFFIRRGFFDFHIKKDRMKMILFWGLPQIPHLMTTWLRQGCDQYFINHFYSTQEVGLFSFALNLVSVITMIGMAFNSSNSVTIFQVLSDKNIMDKRAVLNKNTRSIFFVYLGSAIVITLFGVVLVPIALPNYVGAIPFFVILSVYGFMACIYFLFCNYLFYYGHTRDLMFITFGTSIIHLCLSLLLTRYSLFFTSVIYILSQTLCVLSVYLYSKKILMKELGR